MKLHINTSFKHAKKLYKHSKKGYKFTATKEKKHTKQPKLS